MAVKRLPPTHTEQGPEGGKYVWHKAGDVELGTGPVELIIDGTGTGFVCPDVVVLTKDAGWSPKEQ